MSLVKLINAVETAIKAEDISINYFSKLSRRIGRLHPLSLQFERFAKEKVLIKNYFSNLLYMLNNKGLSLINAETFNFDTANISKYFNDIEVVGDHSNLMLLFENTVHYQTEVIKFYSEILNALNTEKSDLLKIIQINKEFTAILNQFVDFKSDDYINF
jgi:hypothetical protein